MKRDLDPLVSFGEPSAVDQRPPRYGRPCTT